MIEKITEEQEKLIPVYRDKYIEIGLCTDRINEEECFEFVDKFYDKILCEKRVKTVILDSPYQCWIFINMWLKTKDIDKAMDMTKKYDGSEKLLNYCSPYISGSFDSYTFSFYDYMIEVLGVKLEPETLELYEIWKKCMNFGHLFPLNDIMNMSFDEIIKCQKELDDILELYEIWKKCMNFGHLFPLDDICVVSQRPQEINMVDGVLHCEGGPSIKYACGMSVFSLWGTRVPQWLAETSLEKLDLKDILEIENADVRAVGLKRYGAERIIEKGHGKVIEDKWESEGYKLIDLASIFTSYDYAPFLYMRNPSVPGLVHCEGVPPEIKSIDDAIKWREDRMDDEFNKVIHT